MRIYPYVTLVNSKSWQKHMFILFYALLVQQSWTATDQNIAWTRSFEDFSDFLGEAIAATATCDGSLFILDLQSQIGFILNPQGVETGTFGGKGHGPGEFTQAHEINSTTSGGIAVYDYGKQAYDLFDRSGSHLTTLPTENSHFRRQVSGPGSLVFLMERGPTDPQMRGGKLIHERDSIQRVVADFDEKDHPGPHVVYKDGKVRGTFRSMLDLAVLWDLSPNGKYLGWTLNRSVEGRVVELQSLNVVTEFRLELPRKRFVESSFSDEGYYARVVENFERRRIELPEFLPAVNGIKVDCSGRLWVRKTSSGQQGAAWMVFNADGVPGNIQIDRRGYLLDATDSSIYWFDLPEDADEPRIVKYELK